jgi:ubiquinone/menaquinone biosynthesis C-methylase UbiE
MPDWVISSETPENYARYLVPAVFNTWATEVIQHVQARPGDSVLDVACGTGVAAFELAPMVGPEGRVVGIDLDASMLAIAERVRAERALNNVTFREMSVLEMKYNDGVFDKVVCQHALMFFDDKVHALREMYRVLSHGGKMVITVWGNRMHTPHEAAMADAFRACLPKVPPFFDTLFSLEERSDVEQLLRDAGIKQHAIIERVQRTALFPSDDEYWQGMALGRPIAGMVNALPPDLVNNIKAETLKRIAPYKSPTGYVFPMEAFVIMVVKP